MPKKSPSGAHNRTAGTSRTLAREFALATIGLAVGALVLPALIYFAGATLLGRYEGASVSRTYEVVFSGARSGDIAAWVVVLGPYLLWQLAKLLRLGWRLGAKSRATG